LPRHFCRLLGLGCPKQAFAKIAALSDLIVASAARSAAMQRRVIDQTKQGQRRYTPDAYLGHSSQAQHIRHY